MILDDTAVLAAGAAIVLLTLLAGFFLLRRGRREEEAHPEDGRFEGPAQLLHQDNEPDALSVALVPGRLTVGMLNATLAYRLEIANHGSQHIVGLPADEDGGRLKPIRIDEGPRVWRQLSARLVA